MSRLLTKEEIEALQAETPYIPGPRERFHIVVDAGHADLTPEEVDRLEPGDVIPLDRPAKHPVEIVANAVTVARGVLVEVEGRAAVRVTRLERPSGPDPRPGEGQGRAGGSDRSSADRSSVDRDRRRTDRRGGDLNSERIP